MCKKLLLDGAKIAIYDPKVEKEQIFLDLELDAPSPYGPDAACPGYVGTKHKSQVEICGSALEACQSAHALCVVTEWDEFKTLDYEKIYAVSREKYSIHVMHHIKYIRICAVAVFLLSPSAVFTSLNVELCYYTSLLAAANATSVCFYPRR